MRLHLLISRKIILLGLLFSLLLPFLVKAEIEIPNPLKYKTIEELINSIITLIFYIAIVVGPLMVMIAALYFIMAAGDPEKIKKGKQIIIYTFIGLLIVFLAKALVSVITMLTK